jgi:hypothetical protein
MPRGPNASRLFRQLLDAYMHSELRELSQQYEQYTSKFEELNAELEHLNTSPNPNEPFPNTWSLRKKIDDTNGKLIQTRYAIENLKACLGE